MNLGYAFFVLALYVVLVLAGIWVYEYWERQKARRLPVQMPALTERERRKKLNELLTPFGFGYEGRQDIFYSRMDSWQRKYGYGKIYDEAAAPLNMILDCEPVYFEYDEKKWLIEFWKGQYGMTTGGEVGTYYLPKKVVEEDVFQTRLMYRCAEDEDMLRVKMILWKNGRQLFYRRGYHWWLTGFVLGEYSKPRELEMDIEITLKDMEMRDAFLNGLYEAGYRNEELNIQGTTVWIHFTRPHTRQPFTRTRIVSAVKQMENKRNCRLYRKLTGDYANAYDKLLALQARMPGLYRKLERLGKARFLSGEEEYDQI